VSASEEPYYEPTRERQNRSQPKPCQMQGDVFPSGQTFCPVLKDRLRADIFLSAGSLDVDAVLGAVLEEVPHDLGLSSSRSGL
jgi:hypothetical protein